MQDHAQLAVAKQHVEVVVDHRTGALRADVRRDRRGQAEQVQRLVDQVSAEVIEDTRPWLVLLPPTPLRVRAEAVVAGDVGGHATQQIGPDATLDGEVVVVPAPVLEHAQQPALGLGEGDQLVRLGGLVHEWLVDHHMPARSQGGTGQLVMDSVGRHHHHQLERRVLQQLGRRRHHPHPGEVALDPPGAP